MSTEQHVATYGRITKGLRAAAESYAFVAVDEHGEVFYGADFGDHPQLILRKLSEMRRDVRQYIKWLADREASA